MEGSPVEAYRRASAFLLEAVAAVGPDEWDRPGLGEWSVRVLVAHANRSHDAIGEYLVHPRLPEPRDSTYFCDAEITARAEQAVAVLGDDPVDAVARSAAVAIGLVEETAPDATIGTPASTMTLAQYVPSRTAELTIHGIDLLRALGRDGSAAPIEAVIDSLSFTTRVAAARGFGELLLLATAGRAQLPDGFSVY